MSLMPSRVKFRKAQRGRRKGIAARGTSLAFGGFGLKALENAWITAQQIEAARVAIMRQVKTGGKIWIRIFPDLPVTKKPAETRQGKGKGMLDHWVAVVQRGRILMEIDGLPDEIARQALRMAAYKLPIRTKFVSRADAGAVL